MAQMIALAALLALASCTTVTGNFCDLAEPHRFSDEELAALSDATVTNELKHNRRGAALCGWRT